MVNSNFDQKKRTQLEQKQESIKRLGKAITEASDGGHGRTEAFKRAYTSAKATVERLALANEQNLDEAVQNAELALSTAFERLEGKGEVDLAKSGDD